MEKIFIILISVMLAFDLAIYILTVNENIKLQKIKKELEKYEKKNINE